MNQRHGEERGLVLCKNSSQPRLRFPTPSEDKEVWGRDGVLWLFLLVSVRHHKNLKLVAQSKKGEGSAAAPGNGI